MIMELKMALFIIGYISLFFIFQPIYSMESITEWKSVIERRVEEDPPIEKSSKAHNLTSNNIINNNNLSTDNNGGPKPAPTPGNGAERAPIQPDMRPKHPDMPSKQPNAPPEQTVFEPEIIEPKDIELPEIAPESIPDDLARIIATVNKEAPSEITIRRILFYGPPGTGKSTLACVTAQQTNRPLIMANAAFIINKFQGSGQESILKLFEKAKSVENCILFLDEITGLAEGDNRNNNERECAIDALHHQIDINTQIFIILACNEVTRLPERMRSRFAGIQTIEVGLPDYSMRKNFIKHFSRLREIALSPRQVEELVTLTDGLGVRIIDHIFDEGAKSFASMRAEPRPLRADDVKLAYYFVKDGKDLKKKDRIFLIKYFMASKKIPLPHENDLKAFADRVEGCEAKKIQACVRELKALRDEKQLEPVCAGAAQLATLENWIISTTGVHKEKSLSFTDRKTLWKHLLELYQDESDTKEAKESNELILRWFSELEGSFTPIQCKEIVEAAYDHACGNALAKTHVTLAKSYVVSNSPLTEAQCIALIAHDIFSQPIAAVQPAAAAQQQANEIPELASLLRRCKATTEDIKQIRTIARAITKTNEISSDTIRVAIFSHHKDQEIRDKKSCVAIISHFLSNQDQPGGFNRTAS